MGRALQFRRKTRTFKTLNLSTRSLSVPLVFTPIHLTPHILSPYHLMHVFHNEADISITFSVIVSYEVPQAAEAWPNDYRIHVDSTNFIND